MPRGQKNCPNCKKNVGPRLQKCECGHEFTFKKNQKTDTKVTHAEKAEKLKGVLEAIRNPVIFTPSGDCPVKLVGTDKVAVYNWVEALLKKDNYTLSACKYFVRHFHDVKTPEYQIVCEHVMATAQTGEA